MFRKVLSCLAATSLVATPAAAQNAPRAPSAVGEREGIAGNPWLPLLVGLIAAIAIAVVVLDDDDEPASP